jgi:hypothetical protein
MLTYATPVNVDGTLRDAALGHLHWHWGDAYEITEALGAWRAVRRDNQRSLIASEPEELRTLILADYLKEPVPREP